MGDLLNMLSINLGAIAGIPRGQGRCYVVGGEEVAVFRQRDGSLFATQNRCPHRNGPLAEGLVGNNRVICPLHAHQFNLETGTGNEEGERVEVFSVQERNGNVVLGMDRCVAGKPDQARGLRAG
jgi:nitrite reductase (NADH) small subunit